MKFSFRFLTANLCCAETLATVYGDEVERKHQVCRLQSILNHPTADRLFFVLAKDEGITVAWLRLSRDQKKDYLFRIRGLYTHPLYRNRSLATHLLRLAAKCISEFYQGRVIFSFVLPTNTASLAAHKRAGFLVAEAKEMQPERHQYLAWYKFIGECQK